MLIELSLPYWRAPGVSKWSADLYNAAHLYAESYADTYLALPFDQRPFKFDMDVHKYTGTVPVI